jgi:hypothetical protein
VVAQIQDTGTSVLLKGIAPLDPGGAFNLHLPAFNEDYFSSVTSSDWLLYEYSANTGASSSTLWGIGFGPNHVMNTSTPTNALTGTSGAFERSPITTFFNGTTDFLFSSDLGASPGDSGVANYDITGAFPTTNLAFTAEGEGTSGIIVDNDSGAAQASSIYFGVLGTGTNANSAVKLTQSGLE